jgi:protein associated with RNAse G/E
MKATVGTMVYIQSYKYNGSLHRTWSKGYVLKSEGTETIVVTNKTWVIESDGRRWYTREPAICFFYEDRWYNVISMIRKSGIYYYCNIATPSIYDGESIKNIDLDLDIKVYPDYHYDVLDKDEFTDHQVSMEYDEDIVRIALEATEELSQMIKQKEFPFDHTKIMDLFDEYRARDNQ